MKYILGVDIGTTSLKAVLFDENMNPVKSAKRDYTLITKGNIVEFPAEEYWNLFKSILNEMTSEYKIEVLSIDTQCETMILSGSSGEPLDNAIVWLDNRASKQAEAIEKAFGTKKVYEITGQPEITATWPASKILWFKENKPDIFKKTKKIFLLEDYILYKLTGEFVSEKTLQSSTIYFDIRNNVWWDEMLDFIGITPDMLPKVLNSGELIGTYNGIKVVTGAIDQIAGAIGSGVVKSGIISEMTGTTMVIFVPSDDIPKYNPESKVPCHINYDGKYCLLMWTPTAGMALNWFKNNFCESYSFKDLDKLAEKITPGSDGLTFLPYLCGSTMPKYNPDAKGAFLGLTLEHTKGHAVRSILESVACMLRRNLEYMNIDCKEIRSVGGGSHSDLWCQIKADLCKKQIVTLKNNETACLGSAILAAVAAGIYKSVEVASEIAVCRDKHYTPKNVDYSSCYERFCRLEDENV